jgi:hypothetical protein
VRRREPSMMLDSSISSYRPGYEDDKMATADETREESDLLVGVAMPEVPKSYAEAARVRHPQRRQSCDDANPR